MSSPSLVNEYSIVPSTLIPTRASLTSRTIVPAAGVATVLLLGLLSLFAGDRISYAYHDWHAGELSLARPDTNAGQLSEWAIAAKPLGVNAPLEERLTAWERAPLAEPSEWISENAKHDEKSRPAWSALGTKDVGNLRQSMIEFLRNASAQGLMSKSKWGEGRGLVLTAGNADTFSRVLVTLKILHKHLDSPLPSEIFSFVGEIPSDDIREELESFGATLRVVEDANFHIKATAIIRSSFREVLYLDSDNVPTAGLGPLKSRPRSPTPDEKWSDSAGLWESKAYKRLGVMTWQDYWRTHPDNAIWSIIGVPCRDEWEQEAGQILIDKSRHLDALLLTEWMLDSSRFEFWFNFSDGDKDLFRFSFLALRKRWAVPGRYVGVGGLPDNDMWGFCGHTMVQPDHRGRPMFVHANMIKQIPDGEVHEGFAWGQSKVMRAFRSVKEHRGTGWRWGQKVPSQHEGDEPSDWELEDLDVDCDQLANPDNDGHAMKAASPAVRKRAALEKGLRPWFKGGWNCIDIRFDEPRTDDERAAAWIAKAGSEPDIALKEFDDSLTRSSDGVEILWRDPLKTVSWADDVRLRDFETAFFAEGGHPSGNGF